MARDEDTGSGVLVQVCLECGKEYYFDATPPEPDMTCQKCGNGVFRSFMAERVPDEVQADFAESTERDTRTDDPATDVTRGDLHDLNNL